jgi:hypothetical protein
VLCAKSLRRSGEMAWLQIVLSGERVLGPAGLDPAGAARSIEPTKLVT